MSPLDTTSISKPVTKSFGFLKTTAIGGLLFLFPLIVIGALIGQVVPIVLTIAEFLSTSEILNKWINVGSANGIALLISLSIGVVVVACFLAGIAARRSIGRRFSQTIEKNLLLLFPRYAIFKDQMAGTIGGDQAKPQLKPVWVKFNDASKIALEVERAEGGLVTVYLPGSPDPWSGSVVYMTPDRVEPLDITFSDAVTTFEQLGRHSGPALAKFATES